MAQNMDFRNAFNGFNKEDVVRYLEYLQNKHTAQIAELRNELAQAEQDQAFIQETKEELEQLRQQVAALEAERDAAVTRADALETALCTARSEKAAAAERSEEELEAYRRAERAERQAQERAQQLMEQAHGILADAGVRADENAQQIGAMADQIAAQLAQLQQAVIGSKTVMQETAMAMFAISPKE
jgi:DNA repair exonuclease SbcCD ATPase subunit